MPFGGGAQGASGNPAGSSNALAYQPGAQPTADLNFQNLLQPFINQGLAGSQEIGNRTGGLGPYGSLYNPALNWIQNEVTGNLGGLPAGTPLPIDDAMAKLRAGGAAGAWYAPELFNQAAGESRQLNNIATGGLPYGQQALSRGFSPAYDQIAQQFQQNPYMDQLLQAGLQSARLGSAGANNLQGMAGSLQGTVNPLIQSGFDPQAALFNRSQQQLLDQSNAVNAMSGVAGTPYGASVTSNALGNFDINWQNQQLARQAQAAQAASGAAGQAGNLYGAAPGLAYSSGQAPTQALEMNANAILQALQAGNQAGNQALGAFGGILGQTGAADLNASQLGLGGAQAYQGLMGAPYQAGQTLANNALGGINQLGNLGTQAFNLPQTALNNLANYLKLGQGASLLSGQLGQQGFNQTAQGIGGGLAGANALFGNQGLLSGAGGLFGGGAETGSTLGNLFPSAFATGLDFGGGFGAADAIPAISSLALL